MADSLSWKVLAERRRLQKWHRSQCRDFVTVTGDVEQDGVTDDLEFGRMVPPILS